MCIRDSAKGATGVGQKGQKGQRGQRGSAGNAGQKGQKGQEGDDGSDGSKGQKGEEGDDASVSTAHLAVGTYAILANHSTSSISAGATRTGNLRYNVRPRGNTSSNYESNDRFTFEKTTSSAPGSAAPGTWRAMGMNVPGRTSDPPGGGDPGNTYWALGLFVRVS